MFLSYTIIDEADELLHDDWEEEMTKIMSGGGNVMYINREALVLTFQMQTPMVIIATCCSRRPFPSV